MNLKKKKCILHKIHFRITRFPKRHAACCRLTKLRTHNIARVEIDFIKLLLVFTEIVVRVRAGVLCEYNCNCVTTVGEKSYKKIKIFQRTKPINGRHYRRVLNDVQCIVLHSFALVRILLILWLLNIFMREEKHNCCLCSHRIL